VESNVGESLVRTLEEKDKSIETTSQGESKRIIVIPLLFISYITFGIKWQKQLKLKVNNC
jgi:hypothetical protein